MLISPNPFAGFGWFFARLRGVFASGFGEDLGLANCVGAEGKGFDKFLQGMLDFKGADEADEGAEGASVTVLDGGDGATGKAGALGEFGLVEVLTEAVLLQALADEFLELGLGE